MITAYIFSGPTLPPFRIQEVLGHELNDNNEIHLESRDIIKFLPPVSEGDVYHLVSSRPKIIGIIDGYFENVPAVWHKEILYAMSQGIHVLGASSMGALRAAELATFGMEGIGSIFQAYADGFLNDDDEVTVAHGPAELGFPLLSEAMVNIRRTLDDLFHQGIVSESNRETLLSIAKQLHYKNRNYGKIISLAERQGVEKIVLEKLRTWLPEGRQDQKLLDALSLLETVALRLQSPLEPKKVLYHFENTAIWNRSRTEPKGKPDE